MLRKGNFRVDFCVHGVKFSECLTLSYRTEETNVHCSSTVCKSAKREIEGILNERIEIKHIYLLTEYEEIE